MLSKKVLKDIQSLGVKKYRAEAGLFAAEGTKAIHELLKEVPQHITALYALRTWIEKNQGLPVPVFEISETELQRISSLKTPNEALAVLRQFDYPEPMIEKGISLYLDAVQDPGNLGTIIRIADWFGVQNIVCSPGCADLYNPKVVQSTMASISRVPVWYDDGETWLGKQKRPLYAAALYGKPLQHFKPVKEGILLIGNESKGLKQTLLDAAAYRITIPRIGQAESLNAAVATGIILSHLSANGNV